MDYSITVPNDQENPLGQEFGLGKVQMEKQVF